MDDDGLNQGDSTGGGEESQDSVYNQMLESIGCTDKLDVKNQRRRRMNNGSSNFDLKQLEGSEMEIIAGEVSWEWWIRSGVCFDRLNLRCLLDI